jgi:cbb3-type cytochrome oxidase maturation protein
MSVIYVVLPLALLLGGFFLVLFLLGVRNGQFDDLDTPAVRLILEDREDLESERKSDAEASPEASEG